MAEIEDILKQLDSEGDAPAKLGAWYSTAGDCIFFLSEDGPHERVRVDGLLTVYERDSDHRIIGFQVKGIRAFLQDIVRALQGAKGSIELRELLLAALDRARSDPEHLRPKLDAAARVRAYSGALEASEGQVVPPKELELAA